MFGDRLTVECTQVACDSWDDIYVALKDRNTSPTLLCGVLCCSATVNVGYAYQKREMRQLDTVMNYRLPSRVAKGSRNAKGSAQEVLV
jgi:hypothetical protein